jgi:hypothetical protein
MYGRHNNRGEPLDYLKTLWHKCFLSGLVTSFVPASVQKISLLIFGCADISAWNIVNTLLPQ